MKQRCERCASDSTTFEGHIMKEAEGPAATETLTFIGKNGPLMTSVCEACAISLRKLGWRRTI